MLETCSGLLPAKGKVKHPPVPCWDSPWEALDTWICHPPQRDVLGCRCWLLVVTSHLEVWVTHGRHPLGTGSARWKVLLPVLGREEHIFPVIPSGNQMNQQFPFLVTFVRRNQSGCLGATSFIPLQGGFGGYRART